MKKRSIIFLFFVPLLMNAQKQISIIPQPVKIEVDESAKPFVINQGTKIVYGPLATDLSKLSNYINNYLEKNHGYKLGTWVSKSLPKNNYIMLALSPPRENANEYALHVNANNIQINSETEEGLFYGIQSLLQLLPSRNTGEMHILQKFPIPSMSIYDYPRFSYRGMHLDVGRHFFPVSFVKRYIDYLAYHKLNVFHWHLTEDQGWRIEIKKYPELTKIGGWRNGTIIGRYPGTGSDNTPYGGFYTQEEIKAVVQYAKERYIEVIPEIEMPGHGSAAIAAYPWLSCFPEKPTEIPSNMISNKSIEEQKNGRIKLVQETWGVFDDIFCAGKEETFTFLENVIDEVITLFPSKNFHIGADEAPKTHWKKCPNCQKRMKDNNLKDEHELQSWFVQRIEKYLNSKGKTMIGWDEILEGGLAPNAVVMSWRGETGGIEAAKQKHNVIMTPGNPVYFDHTQSENEDSVTIGGYNPIEKVYAWNPVPKELKEDERKYIIGAQANLWTEYIGNEQKVEYMIFPRMAALSEVLWTKNENKNWANFETRLLEQFKRYDLWNANYSKAYFDLRTKVQPTDDKQGVAWKLETKGSNSKINYSKNLMVNDPPNPPAFLEYKSPIVIAKNGTYGAWTTINGKKQGNSVTQTFKFNKATGKSISLLTPSSKNYPGDGAFTLVNAIQNEKGLARGKEFLGFDGGDCEAIIDFGKAEAIQEVVVHTFEQQGSWIYYPMGIDIYISDDGATFTPLITQRSAETGSVVDKTKISVKLNKAVKNRFVKVVVKNYGLIPDGQPGAGHKAWLFVDEIEIN